MIAHSSRAAATAIIRDQARDRADDYHVEVSTGWKSARVKAYRK